MPYTAVRTFCVRAIRSADLKLWIKSIPEVVVPWFHTELNSRYLSQYLVRDFDRNMWRLYTRGFPPWLVAVSCARDFHNILTDTSVNIMVSKLNSLQWYLFPNGACADTTLELVWVPTAEVWVFCLSESNKISLHYSQLQENSRRGDRPLHSSRTKVVLWVNCLLISLFTKKNSM